MQTSIAGTGFTEPQQKLPQDRVSALKTRMKAESNSAASEKFVSFLPGSREEETEFKSVSITTVVTDLEKISLTFNKRLEFEVDHESHYVTVKLIDRETDKVIKELPPEELQRLYNKLKETIGFLFDERV